MLSRTLFHPAVHAWFDEHFKVGSPAQAEAWPLIKAGRNVLIAALDRELSAAGGAVRSRAWQHPEGTPVSAVARRIGGMHGALGKRPPRRTRSLGYPRAPA
jgi:hypothetical protein